MPTDESAGRLPLGMLPVKTAENPKPTSLPNKTLYEYSVFGAIYLIDQAEWLPIPLSRFGEPARLLKPKFGQANLVAEGLITSETLDARYTTFIIETDLHPVSNTPPPETFRQTIAELIHLLRTVTRQYWLGLMMANEGMAYQAVRTRIESGNAAFEKSGGYSNPFIIRPLDAQMWRFIGEMLEQGFSPSNAEVILSDALLEIRRGALINLSCC